MPRSAPRRKRSNGHDQPRVHARRASAADRGYDHDWAQESAWFRERFPFCVACTESLVPAELTDHIIPTNGKEDGVHFAPWNYQPLCRSHHTIKTKNHDERLRGERRNLLTLVLASPDYNVRRVRLIRLASIWPAFRDPCTWQVVET